MEKKKLTYIEYINKQKVIEFTRICKVSEIPDYFLIEYLVEKKDKIQLCVYKNNDIITIIRNGLITYTVKHQNELSMELEIKIKNELINEIFKQKIKTNKVSIIQENNNFQIEIEFKKDEEVIKSIYQIKGANNG